MRNPLPKSLAALFLLVLPLGLVACEAVLVAGVIAGVGYIQYEKNEVYGNYDADLSSTWEATQRSLAANGFTNFEREQLGPQEGVIDGENIWTRVERHPDGYTRVRVRVGTFDTVDHERKSQLILDDIARQLDLPIPKVIRDSAQ